MKRKSIFDFFSTKTKQKDMSVGNYKCPSCTVSCGNSGALATHMKAKHSNQSGGSILKYVQPKHIPFWKVVAIVGACWVAKQLQPGKLDPARMTFVRKVPVESESETKKNQKVDGRKFNKGKEKRMSYANEFKARVLDEYFEAKAETPSLKQEAFAALYDITQGDLSKWLKNSENIYKAAADSVKRRLFRTGGSKMSVAKAKFADMKSELLLKFKERRSHSRRCSANWIKTKAKQILEEKHSEDVFSTSHGWFCRFLKRFNLCEKVQHQASIRLRTNSVYLFHSNFRLFLSLGQGLKDQQ